MILNLMVIIKLLLIFKIRWPWCGIYRWLISGCWCLKIIRCLLLIMKSISKMIHNIFIKLNWKILILKLHSFWNLLVSAWYVLLLEIKCIFSIKASIKSSITSLFMAPILEPFGIVKSKDCFICVVTKNLLLLSHWSKLVTHSKLKLLIFSPNMMFAPSKCFLWLAQLWQLIKVMRWNYSIWLKAHVINQQTIQTL